MYKMSVDELVCYPVDEDILNYMRTFMERNKIDIESNLDSINSHINKDKHQNLIFKVFSSNIDDMLFFIKVNYIK